MTRLLLILASIAVLPSCLIMPHYETLTEKVSGRVVDQKGKPVQGATVEHLYNSHRLLGSTKTDSAGHYQFGPFRQWFYLVYLGSPGAYPFPYALDRHFGYPDALRIRQANATAFYMLGTREQHLASLSPLVRKRFAVDALIRWTGPEASPSLLIRPDMRDSFVPKQ